MECPSCASEDTGVVDSRTVYHIQGGSNPKLPFPVRRRRRECNKCSHRWTTYESQISPLELLQLSKKLRDARDDVSHALDLISSLPLVETTPCPSDKDVP